MRKDYNQRRPKVDKCTRSMLYVHGGAYYFGSVDEHRYQIQRHARKLQARVLAPRYRLAPQFPFPCGLLDCLATYLELLESQPPETIVLSGDSAGAGMVVSMLVILRDQGLPLPAGAVLLSPWVDLTHSFPSVAGDNEFDYVPAHGFLHRPSMSWPPPNSDDLKVLDQARAKGMGGKDIPLNDKHDNQAAAQGFGVTTANGDTTTASNPDNVSLGGNLSINIDGKLIEIKDQIQMYAHNGLISHPLVSPILQPSLGGLPPLCVVVGGGEMLRDEQIYLAHKAAAPSHYPPSEAALSAQGPEAAAAVHKWRPTHVQLQVWDDMCHVAPTLSFTRPAKFMYRSVAQFGAWALARAQKQEIRILDDDEISLISSASSEDDSSQSDPPKKSTHDMGGVKLTDTLTTQVGKAGDPLPRFTAHMIRQRVTRHGEIFNLAPASELSACNMRPEDVGTIKPGPVRKWMSAEHEWTRKYAKQKDAVQQRRMKEMTEGYVSFQGENPPTTALAGRRKQDYKAKVRERKKSRGLAMWSGWGSKHDEDTLQREEDRDERVGTQIVTADDTNGTTDTSKRERSRSRVRNVADQGQTEEPPLPVPAKSAQRPAVNNQAFPFKLAAPPEGPPNASTMTLSDQSGIIKQSDARSIRSGLSARSASSGGFGLFDESEAPEVPGIPYVADESSTPKRSSRGLFTGSGHIWDAESLGAPTPGTDPERPAPERFITADEMPKMGDLK